MPVTKSPDRSAHALRPACRLAVAMIAGTLSTAAIAAGASAGYSGLFDVPDAETQADGTGTLYYSHAAPSPRFDEGDYYGFNLGLHPRVELGARLTEADGNANNPTLAVRDLLVQLKVKLFEREGWPSLAIGVQDVEGNELFGATYVTSSWQLGPLKLVGGYGDEGLEGGFGGLELTPFKWVSVVAETTTTGERAGLRLGWSPRPGWHLSLLAGHDFEREAELGSLQLSLPLGSPRPPAPRQATATLTPPVAAAPASSPDTGCCAEAEAALRAEGFDTATVTPTPGTLRATVDRDRFHRAAADALGTALATLDQHAGPNVQTLGATASDEGLPLLTTHVDRESWRASAPDSDGADLNLSVSRATEAAAAPSRTTLVLEPNLVTFYATEVGVLDFDLALRARLEQPLPLGVAYLSVLTPSVRTDDFDDGGVYAEDRPRTGISQAYWQLPLKLSTNSLSLISLGYQNLYRSDFGVIQSEHLLESADGRHGLRMNLAGFVGSDDNLGLALLDYRLRVPEWQWIFSLGGGRFIQGDTGLRASAERWIGDTAISLFVRVEDQDNMVGGISLNIPLSGRLWSGRQFEVRGTERWTIDAQTAFNSPDGRNNVRPRFLTEPRLDRNLFDTYLDGGRLSPVWTRHEPWRLRTPASR